MGRVQLLYRRFGKLDGWIKADERGKMSRFCYLKEMSNHRVTGKSMF
jgi:hypothetical protein